MVRLKRMFESGRKKSVLDEFTSLVRTRSVPGNDTYLDKIDNLVSAFLRNGGNVNIIDPVHDSFLHIAVQNKDKDVMDLLLEKGANPNIKNDSKWTPLHLAVMKNDADIVKSLLDARANPNVYTDSGKSPLDLAKTRDIKDLLLKYGALE